MKIVIEFNEVEIETLQCMYTEYCDQLASISEAVDYIDIDENRIKDLEDRYDVIEHICHAIEGIE